MTVGASDENSPDRYEGHGAQRQMIVYFLGIFIALTLCFSMYLDQKIMQIAEQLIIVDKEWSSRNDRYAQLRELVTRVNAPGNDVFESNDIRSELENLRMALDAFAAAMSEARMDLSTVSESHALVLVSELDKIDKTMDQLVSEALQIFTYIDKDMHDLSVRRMSAMDRRYAEASATISLLQAAVRNIQQQNFVRQLERASNLKRYEYLHGGLIVLMIIFVVLFGRQVTKRAKEEIRDKVKHMESIAVTENRCRAVMDSMSDAHIMADQYGMIQDVNPAGKVMFGYTMDEMLGKNLSMLMQGPDKHAHAGYIDRYHSTEKPHVIGKRRDRGLFGCRKDGSRFAISIIVHRVEIAGEHFYSGLITDLSEETLMKEELQLVKAALDHTDEAIVITDTEGRFKYVNPAFHAITGYNREEAIGQTASKLLRSGKQSDEFYENLWTTITNGCVWEGQLRNRKKDGTLYDERQTISPIRDPKSGKITGYVAVKRDITEQLQMGRQLNQAQKLESIGQLAAGIAHEINTPTQYVGDNTRFVKDAFDDIGVLFDKLTDLQASANDTISTELLGELLEQADVEYLKEEIPRALAQSLEGVDRVAKIVRAMKEFSHPAQEKTLVNLNAAIKSTLTVATSEYKYVADLKTDFDPDLPQVSCLPGEFNQVVLNMIVNAAHAIIDELGENSQTRGVITVTTRKAGDWAEIAIADTGCGMPEDVKARIFDPFFTTKEVGRGTGQGLNIAHDVVVNKHAGQILVNSEPGKGTCFTVRLPLEQSGSSAEIVAA